MIKAEDILYVMRKGVKYYDKTISLFYPEPVSTINTLDIERFKKNRFSTTDELIYASSHKNEIEPLLHTMYVDKKLEGVQAVQTLSRLNRSFPPFKEDTFVLDFYNKAEDVKKEFEKYYTTTILSEETDPNDLNVIQRILDTFNKRFAGYKNKSTEILAEAILQATRKNLEEGLAL